MKSIIITGISGFVGTNLSAYLRKKNISEVSSLSLRNGCPASIPAGTTLIHLAGKAHDTRNTSDPEAYSRINTELTRQLFERFLDSEIRDFIYFSSVKAVADTVTGALKEDYRPDPQTPYGKSKLKAEEYILSKPLPEEKRVFILRPCMIHGPGNKGNLSLLYKVVRKGIPYPLGAFENRRSFLSIQNLLFLMEKILSDPVIPGGVYNVADDEPLSTNEVIRIIGEAAHIRSKIWKISPGLIKTIARTGDQLHLPLNSERLKKLTESYVVSNEKIKKALNIDTLPVSSREGLLHTIKSFES